MKKLAIITTHPIQYNAPLFRLLTERGKIEIKVFYTIPQFASSFYDPDFQQELQWDIPLLSGYAYQMVENISPTPSSKNWNGVICPQLIPDSMKFNPDAILVYGWNLQAHYRLMTYSKGKIPVWFRGDSHNLDPKPLLKSWLRNLILRWVYRRIDLAFYVGAANYNYFRSVGIKKKQLRFAPHAIEQSRFADKDNSLKNKAIEWRLKLGFSESDLIVLFCGKFESKKGPVQLLNAVVAIHDQRPDIKLLFVGGGRLELELKKRAKNHDFIRFLPFQNQQIMPIVYRLGNLFCLPSSGPNETWGLAVNEAMACGLPSVVTDKVGCAGDLVKNSVNGYVYQSDNSEQLKKILLDVDNDVLAELVEGVNKTLPEFSMDRIAEQLENELKG